MRHIHFKLVGNLHLAQLGITEFELNPQTKLQIILGTNGSGKSTIMRELSPLSINLKHYMPGGGKYGTIEHKGSIYEYLCIKGGPKNHYKLVKDGEVIYEGHVASAYDGYVKEETKITPDIHALCIGANRLSTMQVGERRAQFTRMSPVDFSYAIDYYKRLGVAHRDVTGSITRSSDRLVKEKDKMIGDTEAERLRKEIDELRLTKSDMLKEWTPINRTVMDVLREMSSTDEAISNLSERYMASLRVFANHQGYKDSRDIVSEIAELNSKIKHHDDAATEYFDRVENSRAALSKARAVAGQDVRTLNQELDDAKSDIKAILEKVQVSGYRSPRESKEVLIDVSAQLHSVLSVLPIDSSGKYTYQTLEAKESLLTKHTLEVQVMDGKIKDKNAIIEAYEHKVQIGHTVCPKCDYRWIEGMDENHYRDAITVRDNISAIQANIRRTIAELETDIVEIKDVLQSYSFISSVMKATASTLSPLWNYITEQKLIRVAPTSVLVTINIALADLEKLIIVQDKEARIEDLKVLIRNAEQASYINIEEITARNKDDEDKLHYHGEQGYQAKTRKQSLTVFLNEWDLQEKTTEQLERLQATREHLHSQAEEANKKEVISTLMLSIDAEIFSRERQLSRIETQAAIIASIEEEVATLRKKEVLLKRAINALSPASGLIAKGLTGFINHFIEQSNAIIENVWLYPLELRPVKIDEEKGVDLDYNFPYNVNNKTAGVDVKEASGAQKEIFDLAYMLLSMKKNGLEDFPVFLDEFSVRMDVAHRREAMRMVLELLTSSNFSQIFLVSHFEGSYSSLGSADITVLNPDNLDIPADFSYNEHALIKRE